MTGGPAAPASLGTDHELCRPPAVGGQTIVRPPLTDNVWPVM